jgi:hypothetical protein
MNDAAAPTAPVNTFRRWLRRVATKRVGQYSGVMFLGGALLLLAWRYAQLRGADTDFWPRWYGLRALLLDGRDPYAAAVTAEIVAQTSLAAAPEAARAAYGFVYPLPGALLLAPLTSLPYEWAAAVWLALGLPALVAAALLAARSFERVADGGAAVSALPLALAFVPALWNVALVQPGLAVVPLLALAIWAAPRRSFLAGVAIGCAALLKPQMAAPLAAAWAIYNAACWRQDHARRMLAGLAAVTAILNGAALLLLPSWPASFLEALRTYAAIPEMHALSPAIYRLVSLLPVENRSAALVTVGASAFLTLWVLGGWRQGAARGIDRTIVAGALLVPPAWETNALVLLIPLARVLGELRGRASVWLVPASVALSVALAPLPLVLPWRSGAIAVMAYAALWAGATGWLAWQRRAARSAAAAGAV